MDSINDYMFVFYWRESPKDKFAVSQPVSLGELIDGGVELELDDGGTLPLHDIDWSRDQVKVTQVPPRKYIHSSPAGRE